MLLHYSRLFKMSQFVSTCCVFECVYSVIALDLFCESWLNLGTAQPLLDWQWLSNGQWLYRLDWQTLMATHPAQHGSWHMDHAVQQQSHLVPKYPVRSKRRRRVCNRHLTQLKLRSQPWTWELCDTAGITGCGPCGIQTVKCIADPLNLKALSKYCRSKFKESSKVDSKALVKVWKLWKF